MENELNISEMFFSIQGEGPTTGTPSLFIRLGKCNLSCGGIGTLQDKQLHNGATWRCDSMNVWTKYTPRTFDNILDEISKNQWDKKLSNGAHLVLTGGEPLLNQSVLSNFLSHFINTQGFIPYIEVETNGTIVPSFEFAQFVHRFNVSPKLKNSGMKDSLRINPDALRFFSSRKSVFKFVVTEESHWDEISNDYQIPHQISNELIYLMPGADNRQDLEKVSLLVSQIAIKNNVNFTTRLQIVLWNKTVGV